MPQVAMSVPHGLSREEATSRIRQKADFLRSTYGAQASDVEEQWVDNVLHFKLKAMGFRISGAVTVEDSAVRLEADVPLVALAFRGMIEAQVRKELDELLA